MSHTAAFQHTSRRDRDEDGFPDVPFSAAGLECQNCGETVARLTLVPEFEYMGCDECMEEALAVIAREAIEAAELEAALLASAKETAELLDRAGCTAQESAAYLRVLGEVA